MPKYAKNEGITFDAIYISTRSTLIPHDSVASSRAAWMKRDDAYQYAACKKVHSHIWTGSSKIIRIVTISTTWRFVMDTRKQWRTLMTSDGRIQCSNVIRPTCPLLFACLSCVCAWIHSSCYCVWCCFNIDLVFFFINGRSWRQER